MKYVSITRRVEKVSLLSGVDNKERDAHQSFFLSLFPLLIFIIFFFSWNETSNSPHYTKTRLK